MTDSSGSILTSIKKILGIAEDYTIFDPDIILHVNSALSTLSQLGIGSASGFMIEDESATWDDFLLDDGNRVLFNAAKTYVGLRVRLVFDPPSTSYVLDSFAQQIKELEWRLNIVREGTDWTDPDPTDNGSEVRVIDGGGP